MRFEGTMQAALPGKPVMEQKWVSGLYISGYIMNRCCCCDLQRNTVYYVFVHVQVKTPYLSCAVEVGVGASKGCMLVLSVH